MEDVKKSSSNLMRMFTAKNTLGSTKYTYEIELQVEDSAIKYLAMKLENLYRLLKELNLYYIEAIKTFSSVDPKTGVPLEQKSNFNIYLINLRPLNFRAFETETLLAAFSSSLTLKAWLP